MTYVIGIDLGGTGIKAAALDSNGKRLGDLIRVPTERALGEERVLRNLLRLTEQIQRTMDDEPPTALGVSIPGTINAETGDVLIMSNFPGWERFPLRQHLMAQFGGRPVALENDANSAALGERWVGVGKNIDDFLFVTLGTGVGGGLVIGGELYRGKNQRAGEFGHLIVKPGGELCGCKAQGCLEMYASETAMLRMAREELRKRRRTLLRDLSEEDDEGITAKKVFQVYTKGDRVAREIVSVFAQSLGIALADVRNILDINTFFFGGGVSRAFPVFSQLLKKEVAHTSGIHPEQFEILDGLPDAGVLGMAYLAWKLISN